MILTSTNLKTADGKSRTHGRVCVQKELYGQYLVQNSQKIIIKFKRIKIRKRQKPFTNLKKHGILVMVRLAWRQCGMLRMYPLHIMY